MRFKAVNWSPNEFLGEHKLDAFADNANYLLKRTPRVEYRAMNGAKRVENTKIASGRIIIPKDLRSATRARTVNFDGFFSTPCQPVITTGIIANFERRIHCVIRGRGALVPDSTGFVVTVAVDALNAKYRKIRNSFYVAWTAVGY